MVDLSFTRCHRRAGAVTAVLSVPPPRPLRRALPLAFAFVAIALSAPAARAADCQTGTVTFSSTGAEQCYTVPAGATGLAVLAVGGAGGIAGGTLKFGAGAAVSGDVPVTAGETVFLEVGQNGRVAASFGGGGAGESLSGAGGGASDLRTISCGSPCDLSTPASLQSRLLVAGGGGGDGGAGNSILNGVTIAGGLGGAGGVDASGAGNPGDAGANSGTGTGATGGGGGGGASSTTAGTAGTAGHGASADGTAGAGGSLGAGGSGAGGGGGGGFFGGGSGGTGGSDGLGSIGGTGGGGAGSSFAAPSVTHATFATDTTAVPRVMITPMVPTPAAAPAITSTATATFQTGRRGSIPIRSTGAPTPALSETGALPPGVSFVDNADGTAALSGTPGAGAGGVYSLTITATNGQSPAASQRFVLIVQQPPAVTGPTGATFVVGRHGSVTIGGAGFPAPVLSVSGSLPAGVSFTGDGNGTATLSGTPTVASGGTHVLTIRAANGVTPSASRGFTLDVQAPPGVSLGRPAGGARYTRTQKVSASYSCAEGPGGPGLASCIGTVRRGARINTSRTGRHSFTVVAVSSDGLRTTRRITYTVALPSNRFKVSHVRLFAHGRIGLWVRVPGPGSIGVLVTAPNGALARAAGVLRPARGRFAYGRKHARARRAGTVKLTVGLTARGRRLVSRSRHRLTLSVRVSFTPTGGRARTVGRRGPRLAATPVSARDSGGPSPSVLP